MTSNRFSILKNVVPGDPWIYPAKWSPSPPSMPLPTVALQRGRRTKKYTEHFLVIASDEHGRVRIYSNLTNYDNFSLHVLNSYFFWRYVVRMCAT